MSALRGVLGRATTRVSLGALLMIAGGMVLWLAPGVVGHVLMGLGVLVVLSACALSTAGRKSAEQRVMGTDAARRPGGRPSYWDTPKGQS